MEIILAYVNIAKFICLDSKIIHVGWRVVLQKVLTLHGYEAVAKMHSVVLWFGYEGSQVIWGVFLFCSMFLVM